MDYWAWTSQAERTLNQVIWRDWSPNEHRTFEEETEVMMIKQRVKLLKWIYHQLSPPQLEETSPPQLGSGQLSAWEGGDQLWETVGHDGQDGHEGQLCCFGHGSALECNVIGIGNGNGSGKGNGMIRKRFFWNSKAMAAAFFRAMTPWREAVLYCGPNTSNSAATELSNKHKVIVRILNIWIIIR